MKLLTLFAGMLILSMSFSFALAENISEDDLNKAQSMGNLNYSEFTITSDFSMIKLIIESGNADKLEGQKLEGALGSLLKNEVVNIYAMSKTGEQIKFYIETENSAIKSIGMGENEKPTIKVWADEKLLNDAKERSGESGNFMKLAYEEGAIKIKGVGLMKSIKLWFLIKIGKFSGMI